MSTYDLIVRGVALVAAARGRGVDVTCETCAHYLVLAEEDAEALGAVAKCAPPLRPREDLKALWEHVREGNVEFIASDHSPCPPDMKVGDDMFRAWGSISDCQSLLNVMLDEGPHGRGGCRWKWLPRCSRERLRTASGFLRKAVWRLGRMRILHW